MKHDSRPVCEYFAELLKRELRSEGGSLVGQNDTQTIRVSKRRHQLESSFIYRILEICVNNAFRDTVPYCECGLGFGGSKQEANTTLSAPGATALGDDWFCHRGPGAPALEEDYSCHRGPGVPAHGDDWFRHRRAPSWAHSLRARHCYNELANSKLFLLNGMKYETCLPIESAWMGCKYEFESCNLWFRVIRSLRKYNPAEEAWWWLYRAPCWIRRIISLAFLCQRLFSTATHPALVVWSWERRPKVLIEYSWEFWAFFSPPLWLLISPEHHRGMLG